MGGRKETAVGVEETWAGEEKEFFEDGNGKGDEGKEICMDGWMVYIHKKSGRDALSLVDVSQS